MGALGAEIEDQQTRGARLETASGGLVLSVQGGPFGSGGRGPEEGAEGVERRACAEVGAGGGGIPPGFGVEAVGQSLECVAGRQVFIHGVSCFAGGFEGFAGVLGFAAAVEQRGFGDVTGEILGDALRRGSGFFRLVEVKPGLRDQQLVDVLGGFEFLGRIRLALEDSEQGAQFGQRFFGGTGFAGGGWRGF